MRPSSRRRVGSRSAGAADDEADDISGILAGGPAGAGCIIVKMGGSILTPGGRRASRSGSLDRIAVRRLAECLRNVDASMRARMILLLGGGSIGHPIARALGFRSDAIGGNGLYAFRLSDALGRLAHSVAEIMARRGVRVLPLHAPSLFESAAGTVNLVSPASLLAALCSGYIPLLTGGVVLDRALGPVLLSSDRVPIAVNRWVSVRRFIALTDQPGIRVAIGADRVVRRVTAQNFGAVLRSISATPRSNVSGGMTGKLQAASELAQAGVQSVIGDGRDLTVEHFQQLIGDDPPGTVVGPWRRGNPRTR